MSLTLKHDDSVQTNAGREKHGVGRWVVGFTLLVAVGLLDAALVLLPANAVSGSQVFAGAAAFVIIAAGILYTIWRMER
jgi:hypothetical protein